MSARSTDQKKDRPLPLPDAESRQQVIDLDHCRRAKPPDAAIASSIAIQNDPVLAARRERLEKMIRAACYSSDWEHMPTPTDQLIDINALSED